MALVLAHLAATLFMTGLIWFVQVVHYPLFGAVGAAEAVAYAREHARRTGWVVGPPMLAEAATAAALALAPPAGVGRPLAVAGLALLAVVWLSTAALQVPAHRRLGAAPDARARRRLVATNWLRTAGWTARAALALLMAWRLAGAR